ncbi:DUF1877 family protein [Streptomyces monticola]|uniref:DUF1877 family protein n=1 Tax=Streptomyces monticola TaxID=2666263 RepID=A0ABW2JL12_9ACTN
MGFWLFLTRHDPTEVHTLLDHPDGPEAGRALLYDHHGEDTHPEPTGPVRLRTLEEANTTRTWDALHLLFTGCSDYGLDGDRLDEDQPVGEPPARDVIWGGLVITPTGEASRPGWDDLLLLDPAEVRAVNSFLSSLDRDALIAERYEFLASEGPYSFGLAAPPEADSATGNMVQSGALARDFDVLRNFYARAAAAGNAVIKSIG